MVKWLKVFGGQKRRQDGIVPEQCQIREQGLSRAGLVKGAEEGGCGVGARGRDRGDALLRHGLQGLQFQRPWLGRSLGDQDSAGANLPLGLGHSCRILGGAAMDGERAVSWGMEAGE